MAETNKSILRRYIDELNRRNLAVVDEIVSPELREFVRRGYERNVTAFPDYQVTIHDMIAEANQVVLEWSHVGVHRGVYDGMAPTGKTIVGRAISIYEIVDGLIAGVRGIWDRGEVWQQLGLIPSTDDIMKREPDAS